MRGELNFWYKMKYKHDWHHKGPGQAPETFWEGDSCPGQGGSQQQRGVRGREALQAMRRLEIRVSVAAGSEFLPPSATYKGKQGKKGVESNCVAKNLL